MRGTRGYLAPEWITGVAVTAKADVYSYGMMLFEIISGRRNFDPNDECGADFFPIFAANKLVEGDIRSLLRHRLNYIPSLEELERTCKVALWCVQDDENNRPTMGQVVHVLEGVLDIQIPLVPRTLQLFAEGLRSLVSSNFSSTSSQSHNSELQISKSNRTVPIFAVRSLVWRSGRIRRTHATTRVVGSLVPFTYSSLHHATKNFSEQLGGGSFGTVYKGLLPDSTAIAVKMLQGISQGEKQFRAELTTIGTLQHKNLIRLLGFCTERKKMLVYEYMSNGSLAAQLFKRTPALLDWNKRYQIAVGIARGLTYLHERCRDCIVHCDIKPENILLDASFIPKLADFGLAKIIGHNFSRVLTTIRGTRGYLAPEWIAGMTITPKADVYSYGMMLFEIISGKRNTEKLDDSEADYFPTVAASRFVKGDIIGMLDSRLNGDIDLDKLERACKIAFWCIQENEGFRPTMGQVVQVLEGTVEIYMPPIPRSLAIFAGQQEQLVFFSEDTTSFLDLQEIAHAKVSKV